MTKDSLASYLPDQTNVRRGLKKFMDREFEGIIRKTFIIDPEGHIAKIYPK